MFLHVRFSIVPLLPPSAFYMGLALWIHFGHASSCEWTYLLYTRPTPVCASYTPDAVISHNQTLRSFIRTAIFEPSSLNVDVAKLRPGERASLRFPISICLFLKYLYFYSIRAYPSFRGSVFRNSTTTPDETRQKGHALSTFLIMGYWVTAIVLLNCSFFGRSFSRSCMVTIFS